MAVKMIDIAKKAGVSLTTVSRVLSNDENISVSKETRESILKYARELGYVNKKRSTVSSSRKSKSTPMKIGYILTTVKEKFKDPFYAKMINGIEQSLFAHRIDLGFAFSVFDLEDPVLLDKVLNSNCDGVILIGNMPKNLYDLLIDRIPNCVSIFEGTIGYPIETITIDFEKYAYLLMQKLIGAGHKVIAFIGGPNYYYSQSPEDFNAGNFYNHEGRFRGYIKALMERGLEIRRSIIKDCDWDIDIAYKKMLEIIDNEKDVTAVLVASDRMAIGVMGAIQERGMKIPDDFSLASFDDIEVVKYLNPPLTTVRYPIEEMGRFAVKLLIDKNNPAKDKDPKNIKTYLFPSYIIERNSIKNRF